MSRALGTLIAAALIGLALNPALAQTIYKTVDENGNVVYSDTNPDGDGVPVTLRELSVVKPGKLETAPAAEENRAAGDDQETAQAAPPGLSIVSPQSEETIWNTAYVLSVALDISGPLPEGSQLAYIVDGEVKETSRSPRAQLTEVFRGEHQLTVELRGSDGRTLASAGPVTFFMRQGSANNPG